MSGYVCVQRREPILALQHVLCLTVDEQILHFVFAG